jgi:hypothetical protein
VLLVLGEVEIPAATLQFLRAERELAEDVHRGLGVMGQFLLRLPVIIKHVPAEADVVVELCSLRDPVAMPQLPPPVRLRLTQVRALTPRRHRTVDEPHRLVGRNEKLQFHLLELA